MERFLQRHKGRIKGTIAGLDRVLFRGQLISICHIDAMDRFLSSQHVLYKDFSQFAQMLSYEIKSHAEQMASESARPFHYLTSSTISKEEFARSIMRKDNVTQGLICILSCVEPCHSFSIHRDCATKHLKLVWQQRKCLHLYFYFVDREFGFMHLRLQTWLPFTIQVCINGREWLAGQLDRAGIGYTKVSNCFTRMMTLRRLNRSPTRSTLFASGAYFRPWLEKLIPGSAKKPASICALTTGRSARQSMRLTCCFEMRDLSKRFTRRLCDTPWSSFLAGT